METVFPQNIFPLLASSHASLRLTEVSAEESWMRKNPRTWRSQHRVIRGVETSERFQVSNRDWPWETLRKVGHDCPQQTSVSSMVHKLLSLAWQRGKLKRALPQPRGAVKLLSVNNGENAETTWTDNHRTRRTRWARRWETVCCFKAPWCTATHGRLFWSHSGHPTATSSRTALRHQGLGPLSEAQPGSPSALQLRESLFNLRGSLPSSSC